MVVRSLLAAVVVCALFVNPVTAQDVPRVVAFSGIADGTSPPSKPVAITIAIYDDAAATSPLFLETHTVQLGQNRQFDVLLGSATGGGLPAALFDNNAARWIGVQVAGLPEQSPRIMVVSVPYALKSADSDKLGGLPASEYLTEFDPSSANAYTDAQVAAEAAARAAADTTLQSNIDAEAAARAQGDIDTLGAANAHTDASVAAEAAARAAADTTLQSNIDAEAVARAQGDINTLAAANTYTDASVAAEAAARAAADTTLQSNIDAEAAARAQGDIDTLAAANTYTTAQVAAEAAARSAADTTLQSNIDAEAAARAQGDIDTLAAANTYTDAQVAAEAAARSAADTTLQSNIDAEAAARAQGDINALAAANSYADAQVAAEAAARSAADALRQLRVTGACGANSAMVSVNLDGSVNCVSTDVNPGDDITSLLGGAGISITGAGNARTITNTGDTNTADDITSLTAGLGISIAGSGNARTIINAGDPNPLDDITSLTAGTGISISGSGSSRTIGLDSASLFANANGVTFGNGGSGVFTFNSLGPVTGSCGQTFVTSGYALSFPQDIAGGCGDRAFLAYYRPNLNNDATLLEIGVQNDADDDIALMTFGGVGIGTRTPQQALDVNGTARAICFMSTNGSIFGTCSSDARLKMGVRPFTGLLDKVTALQPVRFEWNPAHASALHLSGRSFGLIAQEVEKVLPEMVTDDGPGGFKAVHYDMLPMMMLQAMRELKEENDTLKRALAEQAARLEAIEAAIKK